MNEKFMDFNMIDEVMDFVRDKLGESETGRDAFVNTVSLSLLLLDTAKDVVKIYAKHEKKNDPIIFFKKEVESILSDL